MNFELNVKEILKETYILIGKINNKELIKNLIEVVKKNKDENLSYKKTHPFIGWVFLLSEVFFHAFEKAFFAFARLGFKIGRCL